MRTDTFGAEADVNDLGIDRVVSGGGPVQTIGPTLQFDLTNLGWQGFGWPSIANDSGTINPQGRPSGIRVSGVSMNKDLPRIDDGFCQTGNARITFNLDDLRAPDACRERASSSFAIGPASATNGSSPNSRRCT